MPEGPEIRRAADKVARRLVGGALTSIKLPYPPISEFDGVLGEASVESVTSRGKALLMRFDNGLTLYSHSQLYGRWTCLLYTSPSPRDIVGSRMPSSA